MKHLLLPIVLLINLFSWSQQNPVSWSTDVKQISDTEYNLIIKAIIEDGWHLYSQKEAEAEIVPIPTTFEFEIEEGAYELIGDTEESETIVEYDKVFETDLSFFSHEAIFTQKIKVLDSNLKVIKATVEYQVCDDELCMFNDNEFIFSLDGSETVVTQKEIDDKSKALSEKLTLNLQNKELLKNASDKAKSESGLWGIFALGFLGGLLALLTPCVFPMIPLTVSFFTKRTGSRKKGIGNAALYGFFIVLIYLLLSIPFHFLDSIDPEILNNIATNVWLNVFFFAIFLFFAFSFFGYYELTLPASWANKMDSASNVGGLLGIFFMAVTLAIVSFSCTGPILGGLLGSTTLSEGDVATNLSAGMVGFGLALALPFALFAMFPNLLSSLPKSGGWLNTVKVVLGFLELALAFKFLSNADLVSHWGILKHEVFIGIWIVVFALMAIYLFGKLKFPHDSPIKKLSFSRISFGILVVAFTVYLIAGLTKYSSLKLLSGFPPPEFYSVFEQKSECPLGLNCFKDFEKGLAYAKANNKPIMLDFTGWACVNCRKMEENVWSTSKVYNVLNDEYVLISLYVDDRKELEKEQQFNFQLPTGRIKTIETIGEKWATFQTINFQTASQPYYVLMTPEMEILNTPQQYTDAETYYNWLLEGLNSYNK
ncbi:protein-disulfide reductase DsbD family protein [Leptobacterium sp. I13]|uniref:protein-disulfide reductase DsbD family protein n=1 Tax=Leptobacterium meishanense TaxID=3128904 RepID=UPI0030ED982B